MYSFQVKYTIEKMFWPVTGHPGLAPDISRQVPDIPGVGHPRCRTSQVPDIPALRRTSQGRCRTSRPCTGHLKAGAGHPRCRTSRPCAGHLKAGAGHPRCRTSQVPDIPGAGHPGLAPDISRQVPDISRQVQDIPALHRTSQGRCRTSQVPDIPGAGHPGLAPDISRQVPDIPGAGHPRCRTSRPCAGHLKAGAGHLKTGTGHPGQALDFLMNSIKDHKSSPRSKSLTLPVANWPTECLRTKPSTLLGSHSFLLLSKVSFSSS